MKYIREEADPLCKIDVAPLALQSTNKLGGTPRDNGLIFLQRVRVEGTVPGSSASCMLTGVLARYQRRLLMLDSSNHSRAFRHTIRPHEREDSRRIPDGQFIGALQLYMRPAPR